MTVNHLTGLSDEVLKAMGTLGMSAEKDPEKLRKQIEGIQEHMRHLAFAVSVEMQRGGDDIAAAEEKLRQADEVRRRVELLLASLGTGMTPSPDDETPDPGPTSSEPTPTPTGPPTTPTPTGPPTAPTPTVTVTPTPPVELHTRRELRRMSNNELRLTARAWGLDPDTIERNALVQAIIEVQAAWCTRNGVDNPNTGGTTRITIVQRLRALPRVAQALGLALALIGAIIGFVLAHWTNGVLDDIHGFGHGVATTFWYIFWILACFGLLGVFGVMVGENIDESRGA